MNRSGYPRSPAGARCCSGRPEAVTRHPEYLALFGHKAAASLAVYSHEHDHAHDLAGEVVALPEPSPAGRGEPAQRSPAQRAPAPRAPER